MYHFIDFTPRLFSRNTSENADVIDYLEYYSTPRTYKKIPEKKAGNPHFRFYDVTSGHVNRSHDLRSRHIRLPCRLCRMVHFVLLL
jgi:hypothetical protein